MKCSKCGNIVIPNDSFCRKCGAPANTFVQDFEQPAPSVDAPVNQEDAAPVVNYAQAQNQPAATYQAVQNAPNQQPVQTQSPGQNYAPVPNPNGYGNIKGNQPPPYYPAQNQGRPMAVKQNGGKGSKKPLTIVLCLILVIALACGALFLAPKFLSKNEADINEVTKKVDNSGIIVSVEHLSYLTSDSIGFDAESTLYVMNPTGATVTFDTADSGKAELVSETNDIKIINTDKALVNYFKSSDGDKIAEKYAEHVKAVWSDSATCLKDDYDGDGKYEYCYLVRDFVNVWKTDDTSWWNTAIDAQYGYGGTVCIFADVDDSGILFNTFYIYDNETGTYDIKYINGELTVSIAREIEATLNRFFCGRIEDAKANYQNNDELLRKLCRDYANYYTNDYDYEIVVKIADICDAPGNEMLYVLTEGYYSYVYAEAFYYGRPIALYDFGEAKGDGAVYLVNRNDKQCLMEYYQTTSGSNYGGIKTTYGYKFLGFDEDYMAYENGGEQIELWDNQTPTSSDNEFFATLNGYLDSGIVCIDPYELTGYSIMQETSTEFVDTNDGKYLNITNCNTNKVGRVAVNWDSWLNLRHGPSVKDSKVLLYSYDKKSFIKLMNGTSITIIDTVNTGDKKNPIWVETQIKYAGMTLTGYSSQTYIDIPNIKHLSVGQSFTVQASTNDTGLYWYSNDSSVLSIDSSTGLATARAKGLVIVEVTSTSGLTDSCLIMVD